MTVKGDRMQKPTVLIVHNRYRIPGGEDTVAENEKGLLEKNGHRQAGLQGLHSADPSVPPDSTWNMSCLRPCSGTFGAPIPHI